MSDQPDPPRQRAVALGDDGERVPRVLAKGYGALAERMVEEARRQGIVVHDAPELVALLMTLDLDQRIPETLYQVVAELLVWVHELDGGEPRSWP